MARRSFWLIARRHNSKMEVLTMDLGGNGEALPLFSFEEEAEMFLRLGVSGTSWWVREYTVGELVSVLCGPCAHLEKVALDPPTELVGDAMAGLVSLSRKDFMRILLPGNRGLAEPRKVPLRPGAPVGFAPA